MKDLPSPGQLKHARSLGIDPHGMTSNELQARIEECQRASAARKQEQWLAGIITRGLTRRLDALLAARRT